MRTLKIRATEPQARFLALPNKYRLFCAGFGAGKSEAMANAAMIDACMGSKGDEYQNYQDAKDTKLPPRWSVDVTP